MRRKPLLMNWFWITEPSPSPYESKFEHIDLFLSAGIIHEKYLAELGVPPEKIECIGMSRYDHLSKFKKEYKQIHSRIRLNIPLNYSFYILYDPNACIRGYLNVSEQVQITDLVLDFGKRNPSVALFIKPHPSHELGFLERQVAKSSLENVFLLDKKMLPYHAINASDLLITKFSTIGIETMFFQKPVISVILDHETQFKMYGDAAEYVFSLETLNGLLTRLLSEESFRDEWVLSQIEKQKEFLRNFLGEASQPAATLAAEAIDGFIKRSNSDRSGLNRTMSRPCQKTTAQVKAM